MHSIFLIRASGEIYEDALEEAQEVLETGDSNNWYQELYSISAGGRSKNHCLGEDFRGRHTTAENFSKKIKTTQDALDWATDIWVFDFNCACGYSNPFNARGNPDKDFLGITQEEALDPDKLVVRALYELERACYLSRRALTDEQVSALSLDVSTNVVAELLQNGADDNFTSLRGGYLYGLSGLALLVENVTDDSWPFKVTYPGDTNAFYGSTRCLQHHTYTKDEQENIYLFADVHT